MNTTNKEETKNNFSNLNGLCRLCGNENLEVINIRSEEGLRNDLPNKFEMLIPIKLVESKEQPVLCCLECLSAILSWHQFIQKVLDTNQRLISANAKSTKKGCIQNTDTRNLLQSTLPSLHTFNQEPENLSNKTNSTYDREDSNEEIGIQNCTPQLTHSSNYSDYDSENSQHQENFNSISKQPDLHTEVLETDKILNPCNPEYFEVSDSENCQNKKNDKTIGIRTKIDPQLIEEAKVLVDDRTYYNCKQCGKSLLSPYTYVWHMRIHTGERPFMCDLCGKQFRVSQGLVRHLKETHKRIKNFPCDFCGRMFATKRNVDEHRRIHTNERPYVCALCSKSFKQKASLFVHNRIHSDHFPFKCDYCSQSFRSKPPLLIHITKHTGQKPYSCDICGRCFRIKYELKRHKLVHSEEKPFVCSSCGLRFKQKRYLRNHLKTNHKNEIL